MEDKPESGRSGRSNSAWAENIGRIQVTGMPEGENDLNVAGRHLVGPLQGFGQLWQKTFRIPLHGVNQTPEEVMALWKARFPEFHPPENRFLPSLEGIKPGQVLLIRAKVPPLPGLPSVLPVSTGVLIIYSDDVSFTVMNPEGHPLSGWNTFSVYEDEGGLVAQVQEQSRPSDPLYELFFRFLGSSVQQDQIWEYVLTHLASEYGITGQVAVEKILIDPKVQWKAVPAIWQNAAIRTVFYLIGWPFRKIAGVFKK